MTGLASLPRRALAALRAHVATFAVLVAIVVAFLGGPRAARAAEASEPTPVETSPRDVPIVMQPSAIRIPAPPASFVHEDHGWLVVDYDPAARERLEPALREADEFKAQLEDHLGQAVLSRVELRVARDADAMAALAPEGLPPPAYASGVAYPPLHLVLLTLRGPAASDDAPDLPEVFRHELAHVALDDATLSHHVPRWFNEGLAVHESGESRFARTRVLWDATLSRTVLPLHELDQGFPNDRYEVNIAYAESADFVRYLLRGDDSARFGSLIERVRKGMAFDRALGDAYGTDLRKLEYQWREENSHRYTVLPLVTGGSFLWVGLFGAMILGWVRRRKRSKMILARWEREEALEAEMRARLERAKLVNDEEHMSVPPPALPKVEHEGGWHTLH